MAKTNSFFTPVIKIDDLKPRSDDAREIGKVIILLLAAGVVLTAALATPGAAGGVAKIVQAMFAKKWRRPRVINHLTRKGFIRFIERDGQTFIELTRRGQRIARGHSLDLLRIKRPFRWDRRWRIVSFDISERHKESREVIRGKLKLLGFRQIQRSVWLLPWKCRAEINFLREMYDIENSILFFEIRDHPDFERYYPLFDLT